MERGVDVRPSLPLRCLRDEALLRGLLLWRNGNLGFVLFAILRVEILLSMVELSVVGEVVERGNNDNATRACYIERDILNV